MAMVVKNNMSAVSTLNTLNKNSSALQKSLSKVSSGMKINSAQDDASGYAISERMRVQIRSLDQANQNTQNGSSMMKTAEGAVSSTVEILKSLKEKAINSANDTNTDSDRVTIQKEIDQFIDQIDDNALTTFNGKYLVDGSKSQYGSDTYTAMTNQSLHTSTQGSDKLTDLKNRNGDSLEIATTDYITASYVQNGNTYTTKYNVGNTTLENVFENLNKLQLDGNNNEIAVFGEPQTSTEKMSATEAGDVISKIGADNDTVAQLMKIAGGSDTTLSYTKDNNGGTATITVDAFKSAVKTLTSGDTPTSSTGQVLAALGVQDADAITSTSTSAALQAVENSFTNAATGAFVSASAVSVTTSNINSRNIGGGNTVSGEVGDTITSADSSITFTSSIAFSGEALTGGGVYTADSSTGTVSTTMDAATFAGKLVDAVKNAVDASSTLTAANSAAVSGSTLTAAGQTTATVTAGTGDTATAGTVTTASVGLTSGTALSSGDADDLAITYAYSKISGGALVNGQTEAIGLKSSGDLQKTANGEKGVTVTAAESGVSGQISGLTLSITDSEGNVKKAANASLDAFSTQVYAKNKSDANELSFQVGAAANQAIAVGLEDMRSEALGLKGSDGSKVSVATQDKANAAINVFDNAIAKALDQQTTIGAIEARLEYTSSNLTTSSENVQAAESTIRDADMAKEMTNYTKNNVLLQAAQSMLAQANQSSSAVLSLLQ